MQHYLKNGAEKIEVLFSKDEVDAYKQTLPIKKHVSSIPVLYLASIWPKFAMFAQFLSKEIYLKETSIEQYKALEVDKVYDAELKNEEIKKVKSFTIYKFSLTIRIGDDIYTKLYQSFVEK